MPKPEENPGNGDTVPNEPPTQGRVRERGVTGAPPTSGLSGKEGGKPDNGGGQGGGQGDKHPKPEIDHKPKEKAVGKDKATARAQPIPQRMDYVARPILYYAGDIVVSVEDNSFTVQKMM